MDNPFPTSLAQDIITLSPSTFNQYSDFVFARCVQYLKPELSGLVRLKGTLLNPGNPSGNNYYTRVIDELRATVKVCIPKVLYENLKCTEGQKVILTGRVQVKSSSNFGVEIQLNAASIELDASEPASPPQVTDGLVTLSDLRTMPTQRNPWPQSTPLAITLVQSLSPQAQVGLDCLSELEKLGSAVVITHAKINVLAPDAIAEAITKAVCDVLIIIRGGGALEDFAVFENKQVLQALASQRACRILGLGHAGNTSLLDLIADHSAFTPAQAGTYVREKVQRQHCDVAKATSAKNDEITHKEQTIKTLQTELQTVQVQKADAIKPLQSALDLAIHKNGVLTGENNELQKRLAASTHVQLPPHPNTAVHSPPNKIQIRMLIAAFITGVVIMWFLR